MTPSDLQDLLQEHGWTQDALATLLPIKSTRTIRYWLSGDRTIRPVIAERIRSLGAEQGKPP